MKNKTLLFLAGLGAAVCYKTITKSETVNKIVYKKEREAVSRYLAGHHPGSIFSDIQKTEKGYLTLVTTPSGGMLALTFTETDGEIFVFSETEIK